MVVLCDKIPDDERRAGFITIAEPGRWTIIVKPITPSGNHNAPVVDSNCGGLGMETDPVEHVNTPLPTARTRRMVESVSLTEAPSLRSVM